MYSSKIRENTAGAFKSSFLQYIRHIRDQKCVVLQPTGFKKCRTCNFKLIICFRLHLIVDLHIRISDPLIMMIF